MYLIIISQGTVIGDKVKKQRLRYAKEQLAGRLIKVRTSRFSDIACDTWWLSRLNIHFQTCNILISLFDIHLQICDILVLIFDLQITSFYGIFEYHNAHIQLADECLFLVCIVVSYIRYA